MGKWNNNNENSQQIRVKCDDGKMDQGIYEKETKE